MGASESVPVVKASLEVPRSSLSGKAAAYIRRVRQAGPLVHCFSNYVAMDIMANALLAAGGSPAMVHSEDECADFTRGPAAALLVNMGTYSPSWAAGMRKSIAAANETGKPWVLDPVGCGATPARTKVTVELARLGPTAIRGNASEILALAKAVLGELPPSDEEVAAAEAAKRKAAKRAAAAAAGGGGDGSDSDSDTDSDDDDGSDSDDEKTKAPAAARVSADGPKGVDSVNTPAQALPAAKALAVALGTVVGVTGAVDVVTDGSYTLYVANGVELCTKVTGAGCALTAIVAAFLTARPAGKHHHSSKGGDKKEGAGASDDTASSAKKEKKSKKDKKGDKDKEGSGSAAKKDETADAAEQAAAAPPTPRGETVVAVASALAFFGMAAQIALQLAREAEEKTYSWETKYGGVPTIGPATLRVGLVDQLHRLSRALASAAIADSERFTRDLGLHARKLSDALLLSTDGAWAADARRVLDTAGDTIAPNAAIAASAAPPPAAAAAPAEGGAK